MADDRKNLGVIGLKYVGLPLAVAFSKAGLRVHGFDVDEEKMNKLTSGTSYIERVKDREVESVIRDEKFKATCDFNSLG
jgi:UDP-N-acetyl-D-glucosamine dehydrogenase